MREGDLAGARQRSAARKAGAGNRVVRRAERAAFDERRAARKQAGDRIDRRRLQLFRRQHLGQNGGQALCEHAFAGARCADQQHVVAAARGDFERALCLCLSAHVGEVRRRLARGAAGFSGHSRLDRLSPAQVLEQAEYIRDGVDGKPLHHRAFPGVFSGDEHVLEAEPLGLHRHGEYAAHRAERAGKGELADENTAFRTRAELARHL